MTPPTLPKGWAVVELDSLRATDESTLVGGPFGSELTQKDYVDAPGVPVIRGSNLGGSESRFVDDGFVFVSEDKASALRRNMAYPGDLVFTQRGTLGQVAVIPHSARFDRYVISQSQMKLTPDVAKADVRYLYHYFRAPDSLTRLLAETQATGVPHINLGILKKFRVLVPPLAEQRRIADILDQADALRAKRRAALAQIDGLTQAIFLEMFGDPVTNSMGWPEVALADLITSGPQNGLYKPAADYGTGVPILRIDGFYDGVVTGLRGLKRVRATDAEIGTYGLRTGDIVVNRVNSIEYLGKSALIPPLAEPTVFESNMMRMSLRTDRAEPQWVIELLQTTFVRGQLLTRAKRAVNQASVNQEDVKSLRMPLPPIGLQEAFASRAGAVDKLKAIHRAFLARLDALFASLQQRAFRGEL